MFYNYMKSRFEDSATETDKYGRIFIKMGFAGFNSRANNLDGYTSKEAAEAAVLRYQTKSKV